jgi:molybdopterin/thiamine biosynthesis adenylyltransferase
VPDVDEQRFSRQIALFGVNGQNKIAAAKVGVVGLGGLGSHLGEQLAYLGVRDFALIDHDIVTPSSLNRVIGAVPGDVDVMPKVEVTARLIKSIEPEATVVAEQIRVEDEAVAELLADRTVVFGGLDSDLARLSLTELSTRLRLPYFDLASDTGEDEGEPTFGGRVVFADGTRCLHCLGLLDQDEIRRDFLDPDARRAHDDTYGIDRDELGETGPAVVSVNGVVASLAVTEFMVWITGLRDPEPQLVYYGERRLIRRVTDAGATDCPYCSQWRA